MIIDCHGHYTTAPKELEAYRQKQIAELKEPSSARSKGTISITDDQIRESIDKAQLKLQRERGIKELGFIGCNLNPDPSGGYWKDPPLTDKWWYPFYEKLVELDVPAMIHVSMSCNPNFHTTGGHYINGDTTAFMQLITADLFKDFPSLKLIIPHGGGAVPYHWGRYRGLAQDLKRPPLNEMIRNNVFFDTCVYHQPGIDLLF